MQLSVQLHVLVLLFSCFLSKIFLSLGSVSVPSRNQTSDTLKICWGLSFTVGSSIWFCFQTSLPRNHSCRSWAAEKLKHSSSRLQSSEVLPCKVQVSLASGLTQGDFHWGLDLQGEHIHSVNTAECHQCCPYLCALWCSMKYLQRTASMSHPKFQRQSAVLIPAQLDKG